MRYYLVTPQSPAEIRELVDDGTVLWIVQNMLTGSMPVLLLTNTYLSQSGGSLTFFDKDGLTPKDIPDVETNPAPISETTILERTDIASWPGSGSGVCGIAAPYNK